MLYILSIPLDLLGSALLMQPQSWWGSGPTPPHQHAAEELWALGDLHWQSSFERNERRLCYQQVNLSVVIAWPSPSMHLHQEVSERANDFLLHQSSCKNLKLILLKVMDSVFVSIITCFIYHCTQPREKAKTVPVARL